MQQLVEQGKGPHLDEPRAQGEKGELDNTKKLFHGRLPILFLILYETIGENSSPR